MTRRTLAALAAVALAGCAAGPTPADYDRQAQEVIRAAFRDQGIAHVDRLNQDAAQRECSSATLPPEAVQQQLQAEAEKTVRWPSDGRFIGDWREGEKLAQSGRGMTWTDASTATSANGGNCYNCHQLDPKEVSYGTIGPSLLHYGRLRGVRDPSDPASEAIVRYTWTKLWNSRLSNACSMMPRFGHAGLLDEKQLRHLMALLLDPKSPVNQ